MARKKKQDARYRALTRIWHTQHERYYEAGESVALDHLADEEILLLLDAEVIELASGQRPRWGLEQIRGIGAEIAKRLWQDGVKSLEDFVIKDPAWLKERVGTATIEQIVQWQGQANKLLTKE